MDVEDLYLENSLNYKNNSIQKCVKCRVNNANVKLPSQRIYCWKCFDSVTNKLFQRYIRKYRARFGAKRTMIAFSGGVSSCVLVHLLLQSFSRCKHFPHPFEPVIVYIDFIHSDTPECRSTNQLIYDYFSTLPFESHIFYKSQLVDLSLEYAQPRHLLLVSYLKQAAVKLNIENILTGENSNNLASLTFTYMGLGLGKEVLELIQSESSSSSIRIFRPLKGFLSKEIAFYNLYNNLEIFNQFDFGNNPNNENATVSNQQQQLLYSLSNEFLNELQMSNECTLSTILRTCEKFKNYQP